MGGIAVAVYAVLLLLFLLLLNIRLTTRDNSGEGILINFGNVDEAAPGGDLAMNDQTADAARAARQAASSNPQEYLTSDDGVTVAPQTTQRPQARPDQPDASNPNNQTAKQPVEQPRQVNQQALFPGRTEGSTSTSDGTGAGAGNQGNPAGSPDGAYDGTGTGNSGNSASLTGRSLVGSLPRPEYNAREQGRVVIEIVVDQQGRVTSAAYRSVGSTTQNSVLVAAAIRAAQQARFNVDEDAPLSQRGTITYNFRMQ